VSQTPALQYLNLIRKRLNAIRTDLPKLTALGEAMAGHMLAGGNLYTPPVNRFWVTEFNNRAGGLMGIHWPEKPRRHDVAFFALPDPRAWDPRKDQTLTALLKSKAQLFAIGAKADVVALGSTKRFAGFTGAAGADEGLFGMPGIKPLACLRPFDMFVRGWIATGEMIAACTRAGKMPMVWMSYWLEGSWVRNQYFLETDNIREPWLMPFFHKRMYIPPLREGRVGNEFLDFSAGIHKLLEAQADKLALAGRWLAEAKKAGRLNWAVAVGHSYPQVLGLASQGNWPGTGGKDYTYPINWGGSFSNLRKAVPMSLRDGAVCLHLGYSPVDVKDVAAILKRGVRFIYSSPYGRPANLPEHKNFIWLDLPWRPADATVDVPGYSVRILPGSSTAQTMAYFAILSEMAARMGWTK
jgi:hypothetical protein